ncbi:MAG: hypothetical protein Q9163_003642 [Psora crenata]
MINAVLVFNNSGQSRLTKFYTQLDTSVQQRLISEIFTLVSNRPASSCNFLPLPPLLQPRPSSASSPTEPHNDTPTLVTYRHYATLYFILISTSTESPLALLDLIQVFVEALDRLFENVCELDLIFSFETLHACLGEMIVGGVVVETNLERVVKGVKDQGKVTKRREGAGVTPALSDVVGVGLGDMAGSIPFRFKAGGPKTPLPEAHHHRPSSKTTHKPFKSRHATKSLLKGLAKGKLDDSVKNKGSRKTAYQQVMSKVDRKNQAKQIRNIKHQQNVKSQSVFAGINGAPRVVAVVPLCEDLNAIKAVERLNEAGDALAIWPLQEGQIRVRIEKFKQSIAYVPVTKTMLEVMDACRVADFVVLLLSPHQEPGEEGESILKAIEGQGVSNVLTMVQGLDKIEPAKRRGQILMSLKSYISHFFPMQEKVLSLDSDSECANLIRSLCTTTPKGIKWRDDRSWMLVEDLRCSETGQGEGDDKGDVVITGVVRGKGLKANKLVQVGDWGHFQIAKITTAAAPTVKKRKADEMAVDQPADDENVLEMPNTEQEDLNELAPYEPPMEDVHDLSVPEGATERRGVLLDDHHYYSDDKTGLPEQPRRLPKGTSNYQAAWFLGDMSDSGSDYEGLTDGEGDVSMGPPALPQDGIEGLDQGIQNDASEMESKYPQSEMFLDPSPNEEAMQIEEYRASRKDEAKEDLEFPDEIELHPNVVARERLARYRGLKSLRTSPWDTNEDKAYEPEDWNRLLDVPDYKRARKQAENESLVGGVSVGTRVNVHLQSVPFSVRDGYNQRKPIALYSLLPHEQKRTVVNISITLSSEHPRSLKSKDELVLQCGPRRFTINPLFSQLGNTPNNVHKFIRYLHPGQTAVASFIGPVTWGAVPALFFRSSPSRPIPLDLIATGTTLPPSRARIIAKRVILTGHPYKIHRKLVTVRYMFFNAEDVAWFKALQLWTKRGRSGFIKESLGTHGYFKATFDGKINPQDAVGVSLYKRVFPRPAKIWFGLDGIDKAEEAGTDADADAQMVEE